MDELAIMQRSDKVVPIKKECAFSAKGHIHRQNLVERVCCLVAERAGEFSAVWLTTIKSCNDPSYNVGEDNNKVMH